MAACIPTGNFMSMNFDGIQNREAGYAYLAILFGIAVMGIGLAAVGEVWSTTSQREKEHELLYVGREFRAAIGRYYESSPGPLKRYPGNIEDLLKDNRFPQIKRHLRRIPVDPITGKAEWNLISAPGGGFMGISSSSDREPIKKSGFELGEERFESAQLYADFQFIYLPKQPRSMSINSVVTGQPSGQLVGRQ